MLKSTTTMKTRINRNNKRRSQSIPGKKEDAFTSYDTSNPETSTPQKVREGEEASSEQIRQRKAEGKT
jgi:hypothetical protein